MKISNLTLIFTCWKSFFFFKKNEAIFNHLDEHFWYKKFGISAIKKNCKVWAGPPNNNSKDDFFSPQDD